MNIEKEKIKIKSYHDDIYFEKNGIILDKFCPVCRRVLDKKRKFCECGFFIKARNNAFSWGVFFVFLVMGLPLLLVLIANTKIFEEKFFSIVNPQNFKMVSISPINIQVISALNNTKYREYVQNVYTKPKEENKLVILIRPSLWNMLEEREKKDILNILGKSWQKLYSEKNPDSKKKPTVIFANDN